MNERVLELICNIDVNPKIRELAERSGCTIDKLGYGEGNLEKFAELLIKECANICYHSQYENGDMLAQTLLYEFDVDSTRSMK